MLATTTIVGCHEDAPITMSSLDGSASAGTTSTSTEDAGESADSGTGGNPSCAAPEPLPVDAVATTSGAVRGTTMDGVTAFLGVPYAAAPIDALRWQPPAAAPCWPDVRDATAVPSMCPQLASETGPIVGDEDCLTLSIWTPSATADAMRPVMVFIHGGGHTVGSTSDPLYDGARLAAAHDVVVVTVEYRLGALGWLALDALDADDPRGVSGNYGLLDQLAALQWVHDNITAFGGDPGQVMLFGESAGAVDTCALVGTPDAEGLFGRAMVQSGTCEQRSATVYRSEVTDPWLAASPCTDVADVAACLRALPVDQVLTTEPTGYPTVSALSQAWSPYVDGVTLPASTLERLANGDALDIPLVIGANAEETARDTPMLDDAGFSALLLASFGPLAPQVQARYPLADYASPSAAWTAITSDAKFICNARRALRAAAQGHSAPVYRYHFSYDGYDVGPTGDASAFHGLELVYVFGNFDAVAFGPLAYTPNTDDLALAQLLGEAWTSFARTGDPSTATLAWPHYELADDPFAGLDVPAFTGAGVRTEQCDFWDGLVPG